MNVVCIFPITNVPENYPKILEIFWKDIAPKLTQLGANGPIEIKFAGTSYIFVGVNQKIGQQKGDGILECLKNCASAPDIVIMCDGSGAIPYDYIVDLFQELVSDSGVFGVMANRVENKAISPERLLIEQFEVFILKRYHNYSDNIPDGQCGLWAYRTQKINMNGNIKYINLTAKSYEIELDLLSELLEKKFRFSFANVELPERKAPSSFTFNNNINKMRFLLNKYPKLKKLLKSYINFFENIEGVKKSLKIKEIKEVWEKYKTEVRKL